MVAGGSGWALLAFVWRSAHPAHALVLRSDDVIVLSEVRVFFMRPRGKDLGEGMRRLAVWGVSRRFSVMVMRDLCCLRSLAPRTQGLERMFACVGWRPGLASIALLTLITASAAKHSLQERRPATLLPTGVQQSRCLQTNWPAQVVVAPCV